MKRAFVVGHPIKHSRSPLIHGYWLKEHGLEGSYERVDVAPSAFCGFLKTLADQGFVGGNVTIPHKEAAFAAVARRTDRAERLKAVNTLWLEDGALWGDNTDILGFTAHLEHSLGASWDGGVETALVIGAGGAARAVVSGALGARQTHPDRQPHMGEGRGPRARLFTRRFGTSGCGGLGEARFRSAWRAADH